MGLTVFVGEKIGAKEQDEAGRIVGSGICLFGGIGIRLPLSWIFSKIEPVSLFRMGLSTPFSTAVQIVLCVAFYTKVRVYTKHCRKHLF